jgi:cytochrome c oxidase assembly factor CtaG
MFSGLDFSWHWSPGTLLVIILLCLLYGLGIRQARKHDAQDKPLKKYHLVAFGVAVVAMACILLTPIDTIARTQSFFFHMVQVVTLITLCAPLLLFSCPAWLLQPLLQQPLLRRIALTLTHPIVASLIFNFTFFAWHVPALFTFAQEHGTLYHVELLSLLFTALLNWWPLIGPVQELRRMNYPLQMLYAFLDGQPVDIFAFLLVFSGTVFYRHYVIPPQLDILAFGDQAAGGAFLLIPGLVDLVVMSPLFIRWLGQMEEQAKKNDQRLQERAEAEATMFRDEEDDEEVQSGVSEANG